MASLKIVLTLFIRFMESFSSARRKHCFFCTARRIMVRKRKRNYSPFVFSTDGILRACNGNAY
jgi:hypothetical protein